MPATCKTCKWWAELPYYAHLKICTNPKVTESEDSDGASIFHDVDSAFAPGPDFGCIHHELKT